MNFVSSELVEFRCFTTLFFELTFLKPREIDKPGRKNIKFKDARGCFVQLGTLSMQ